jgi:hypothetical protein
MCHYSLMYRLNDNRGVGVDELSSWMCGQMNGY